MEEDEPGANRSRLADEWSESESEDDSGDDGGDDFVSTSDDDGQKPCLDISLEDFDRALARGYGCKDGSHFGILPAQHIVSIQCQISRASSREKIPSSLACWLLYCAKRHCRTRAVQVCLRGQGLVLTTPSRVCRTVFVCGGLWKLKHLQKNLPNLMSTPLLLMDTKSKCPGISTVLKRWIELYFKNRNKLYNDPRVANACCTTRQSTGSTYLLPRHLLLTRVFGRSRTPPNRLARQTFD